MKRPAFQFYPADWRKDAALQLCSISARGLWISMLCVMHEAEPYGHLVAAGRAIDHTGLARLVGESAKDVKRWLDELRDQDVFSATADGIIYSRRMVRDQRDRDEWAKRQHKHRDKSVTDGVTEPECHDDVTKHVTPMSQLSSSSSSSSIHEGQELGVVKKNGNHVKNLGTRLPDGWFLPDDWKTWAVAYRPDWDEERVIRESLVFRDYWYSKPGKDGRKAHWLATWRNWVRRTT